ncbi:hypothetical protein Lnau_1664 [Legionella nautarum]|uniref:Uncharacterized protein n=2 Tax=Legionella nautarum TaxID=45070 RepID=A0A0W0WWI6_9GAMM|nr:hypothetical protein [Legionella nautarum]KTD36680.1 hypothetical protein Lnau_1664 [Legionella nautarum]
MTNCYIKDNKSLSFRGSPLVWEYDEDTDTAVCLFKVIGASIKTDKKSIIAYLSKQKIEGLVINGETATLSNVKKNYAKEFMTIVPAPQPFIPQLNLTKMPSLSPKPVPVSRQPEVRRLTRSQNMLPRKDVQGFFPASPEKEEVKPIEPPRDSSPQSITQSTSVTTQTSQTSSSDKISPENEPTGLKFEAVLPPDAPGDLRKYLIEEKTTAKVRVADEYVIKESASYFRNKDEREAQKTTVFESVATIQKANVTECNKGLHVIRELQLETFKKLFNHVLAPLYSKKKAPQKLIQFFQAAMKNAIFNTFEGETSPNESVNIGLTYLEKSKEEIEGKSQDLAKEMLHQAIFARARVHLRAFRFFITNDIKSDALTGDESIQAELNALKLALKERRELFAEACALLEEQTELTGKSGRLATKHDLIRWEIETLVNEKKDLPLKFLLDKYKEFDMIEVSIFEEAKKRTPLCEKQHENLVVDGYSCFQFIKNFLVERFSEKKESKKRELKKNEHIESITDQIIANTIGLIQSNFHALHHIDPRVPIIYPYKNKDFYFSLSTLAQLKEELSQLESKLEQKEYDKPKHEEELVEICTSWLFGFIEGLLQSKVKIESSALDHASKEGRAPTPRRNRSSSESKNKDNVILSPRNVIGGLFRSKSDRDTKSTSTSEEDTHRPKTPRNLSSGAKLDSEVSAEKNGAATLNP